MLGVAAVGGVGGVGLWLIVVGLVPRRRSLADLAAEVGRDRSGSATVATVGWWQRLAVRWFAGRPSRSRAADLAVLERSDTQHAVDVLSSTVVLPAVVLACALIAGVAGVGVAPVFAAAVAGAGAAAGWLLAERSMTQAAAVARRDFGFALATYLDLVTALLVGGAGIETALDDAARLGSGPAFRQLRGALGAAQERREAPWRALGELGRATGVAGLEELGASMALAGEHGARVRASLIAKAEGLRDRELADAETQAARASEAMSLPVVGMGLAFVVLVTYPALVQLGRI